MAAPAIRGRGIFAPCPPVQFSGIPHAGAAPIILIAGQDRTGGAFGQIFAGGFSGLRRGEPIETGVQECGTAQADAPNEDAGGRARL